MTFSTLPTHPFSYLKSDTSLTLFVDQKHHTIPASHPSFGKVLNLLETVVEKNYTSLTNEELNTLNGFLDTRSRVLQWIEDSANYLPDFKGLNVELVGGSISLSGRKFSTVVSQKVIDLIESGNSAVSLFRFLRNLLRNESYSAQNELLLFCAANNFMIDWRGDILAYKSVRRDYTDIHSGKFSNHPGAVLSMPRHEVDDRRDITCSTGFHFASYEYASTWAGAIDGDFRKLMLIRVRPEDVVSIPNDYANQKGRCWRYTVEAEIKTELPLKPVYTPDDIKSASLNDYDDDRDGTWCNNCGEYIEDGCMCDNCCYDCGEYNEKCTCNIPTCDTCGEYEDECVCGEDGGLGDGDGYGNPPKNCDCLRDVKTKPEYDFRGDTCPGCRKMEIECQCPPVIPKWNNQTPF